MKKFLHIAANCTISNTLMAICHVTKSVRVAASLGPPSCLFLSSILWFFSLSSDLPVFIKVLPSALSTLCTRRKNYLFRCIRMILSYTLHFWDDPAGFCFVPVPADPKVKNLIFTLKHIFYEIWLKSANYCNKLKAACTAELLRRRSESYLTRC